MKPSERMTQGWTTKALARDAYGGIVEPWSPEAVSWCTYGAMTDLMPDQKKAYIEAWRRLTGSGPIVFNDRQGMTQDQVVAMTKQVEEAAGL